MSKFFVQPRSKLIYWPLSNKKIHECSSILLVTSSCGNHCLHASWQRLIEPLEVFYWNLLPNLPRDFFQPSHWCGMLFSLEMFHPWVSHNHPWVSHRYSPWVSQDHNEKIGKIKLNLWKSRSTSAKMNSLTMTNWVFFCHFENWQVVFESMSFLNG